MLIVFAMAIFASGQEENIRIKVKIKHGTGDIKAKAHEENEKEIKFERLTDKGDILTKIASILDVTPPCPYVPAPISPDEKAKVDIKIEHGIGTIKAKIYNKKDDKDEGKDDNEGVDDEDYNNENDGNRLIKFYGLTDRLDILSKTASILGVNANCGPVCPPGCFALPNRCVCP